MNAAAWIRVATLACVMWMPGVHAAVGTEGDSPQAASEPALLLALPKEAGPVVVLARFELQDINEINDSAETFEFTGVLTLKWRDPRQAFDPAAAGVREKIYQGNYQIDEEATGWSPQVVLVNESGMFQKSGAVLRVQPDGSSTLIQTVDAVAESEINMVRFPFDAHRLEVVLEVLGFGKDEIVLQAEAPASVPSGGGVRVPQWTVHGISASVRDRPAKHAGQRGVASALVVGADVQRQPFYTLRLVVVPLILIVLLSFTVFWMERSSLGDRLSVSFIGILTGVAYLIVTSDQLPRISYFTLMHGFLNLSFLTMCATVPISLWVGVLDKKGHEALGDRFDRRCRWAFPLVYFGLLSAMSVAAFTLY